MPINIKILLAILLVLVLVLKVLNLFYTRQLMKEDEEAMRKVAEALHLSQKVNYETYLKIVDYDFNYYKPGKEFTGPIENNLKNI